MAEAITSSVIPFELESENQKDKIKEITDKLDFIKNSTLQRQC